MSVIVFRCHSLLFLLIYEFQHTKPRYNVKLRCAKWGRDETQRYTTSHYNPELTLSIRKFQTTLWCWIILLYKNEAEMEVIPAPQGSPSKKPCNDSRWNREEIHSYSSPSILLSHHLPPILTPSNQKHAKKVKASKQAPQIPSKIRDRISEIRCLRSHLDNNLFFSPQTEH